MLLFKNIKIQDDFQPLSHYYQSFLQNSHLFHGVFIPIHGFINYITGCYSKLSFLIISYTRWFGIFFPSLLGWWCFLIFTGLCSWWYLITISLSDFYRELHFFPSIFPLVVLSILLFYFPLPYPGRNPNTPMDLSTSLSLWFETIILKFTGLVIIWVDSDAKLIYVYTFCILYEILFQLPASHSQILYFGYKTFSSSVGGEPAAKRV